MKMHCKMMLVNEASLVMPLCRNHFAQSNNSGVFYALWAIAGIISLWQYQQGQYDSIHSAAVWVIPLRALRHKRVHWQYICRLMRIICTLF
jgi:hypothetical protein